MIFIVEKNLRTIRLNKKWKRYTGWVFEAYIIRFKEKKCFQITQTAHSYKTSFQ